ncbi:MAG: hypothetical protein AB1813_00075 [Verrucomicrobiota bacterium]
MDVIDTGKFHRTTRAGAEDDTTRARKVGSGEIFDDLATLPENLDLTINRNLNLQGNPIQLRAAAGEVGIRLTSDQGVAIRDIVVTGRKGNVRHGDLSELFAINTHADTANILPAVGTTDRSCACSPRIETDGDTGLGSFFRKIVFITAVVLAAGPTIRPATTAGIRTARDERDDRVAGASVINAEAVGRRVGKPVTQLDHTLESKTADDQALIEVREEHGARLTGVIGQFDKPGVIDSFGILPFGAADEVEFRVKGWICVQIERGFSRFGLTHSEHEQRDQRKGGFDQFAFSFINGSLCRMPRPYRS